MVMDSKPFVDLHHILQEIGDDRVWVFAEWVRIASLIPTPAAFLLALTPSIAQIRALKFAFVQIGVDYTSKQGGRWSEGYHERLYSLTDDAIRGEPHLSAIALRDGR